MVHTAMAASIAGPIARRTLTAVERPRAPMAHLLYDHFVRGGRKRQNCEMAVSPKPSVKGVRSSRPPGQARGDPGERRAPYVLLDRHAASRLAMTEPPLSSEAPDRTLLGSCKWREGPAQPFEKAQFAEGKSLDFPSPSLGFSFPKAWIFLPPALILLPPLRADGELSRPTELHEQ